MFGKYRHPALAVVLFHVLINLRLTSVSIIQRSRLEHLQSLDLHSRTKPTFGLALTWRLFKGETMDCVKLF